VSPLQALLDEHVLDLPDHLLDLLPVGVFVCDKGGAVIRYNRAAIEIWGRAPKPGDGAERFCGSHRLALIDGTPIAHADGPMARVLTTGLPTRNHEIMMLRPDGSQVTALMQIDPLKDDSGAVIGAISCFRDVTDQRRLQTAIAEIEAHSQGLLKAMPAALYTTDAAGRITFYNDAAADLWGVRPELGKSAFCGSWKLFRPDGTPLPHDECSMALALKEQRANHGMEAIAERPDGTRIPIVAYPTPLFDSAGRLTGAVNMLLDITERHQTEQRIRNSEARHRQIFDTVRVSVWEQDFSETAALLGTIRAEGVSDLRAYFQARPDRLAEAVRRIRIKDVNAYSLDLFEADCKETLVDSLAVIASPDNSAIFIEMMVACWEDRRRFEGEATLQTLKGRRLDVTLTVAFEGPRFERTLVSMFDISAQKAAERTLRQQTRRLETLNRVAKAIAGDLNLERVVQTVTDAAAELSGAKFGAFFYDVVDETGERFVLHALSGASRPYFDPGPLPGNIAAFAPALRGTDIVRSDDIRTDPRYGGNAPYFGTPKGHLPVVSYLAVPVVSRSGKVLGALMLGHDQPGVFAEDAEAIVTAIAAHAAITIDNARLLQAGHVEVEQRRRAERASYQLAAIVESSDDAILAKDLNGVITSWNRGAQRLFGYTAEEAIGKPVTILIPVERHDEEPAILARVRRGDRIDHYETIRQRKDGSPIEISLTVSPVRSPAGEIIGVSKIARDITDRRRAQAQQQLLLREMNHRVKNLFALASSIVSLSARSAETPAELASAVRERLAALSRAHALTLSKPAEDASHTPEAATLHALIGAIVSPYAGSTDTGAERIVLTGPDVQLSGTAVTSFALLLHEFATNAAKYGALSTQAGSVDIACSEADGRFVLIWRERGGPRVEAQTDGEGFGSVLARMTVKGQLQGEISRDWQPEGLTIRLSVVRDRLLS
jgi:PAS domain S-box-containing protein